MGKYICITDCDFSKNNLGKIGYWGEVQLSQYNKFGLGLAFGYHESEGDTYRLKNLSTFNDATTKIDAYIIPVAHGEEYKLTSMVPPVSVCAVYVSNPTITSGDEIISLAYPKEGDPVRGPEANVIAEDEIIKIPENVNYMCIMGKNSGGSGYEERYALKLWKYMPD